MPSIYDWDTAAANNANADGDINWAEGMPPSAVNDSARYMMARIKQMLIDLGGTVVATGTANALAVTAQSAFTTLADGRLVTFRPATANSGAATLNVNGLGAKPLRKATTAGIMALSSGDMQPGAIYEVIYSTTLIAGGAWMLLNPSTGDAVPVGARIGFCGSTAPDGWLLCFGQAVSRTTYPRLYTAIGTTYGVGNGSTTFNLPDYRGRAGVGKDNMGGTSANRLTGLSGGINGDVLGAVGGAEAHALTLAQNGPHTHPVTGTAALNGGHNHVPLSGTQFVTVNAAGPLGIGGGGGYSATNSTTTDGPHVHSVSGTATSSGSGQAHNNVQPSIVENVIIKF